MIIFGKKLAQHNFIDEKCMGVYFTSREDTCIYVTRHAKNVHVGGASTIIYDFIYILKIT